MLSKSLDDAPTGGSIADDLDNLRTHPQTGNKILAEVEYGDRIDYLVEGSKPSMKGRLVKKHQYENPGHHAPTGGTKSYNPEKSVLPENHIELFEQSQPFVTQKGKLLRFAKDKDDIIHRFDTSIEGVFHWNGSTKATNLRGKKVPFKFKGLNKVRKMLDEN